MAQSQTPTHAPAPTSNVGDEFQLAAREIETDGDEYAASTTTYDREAWWTDQDSYPRDAWAVLASQDPDDTTVDDDEVLVAIRIFAWFINDTDDWSNPRRGYGEVYGSATTLAVIEPASECPKAGENGDEWAYTPVFAGSRKAYRFDRVKNADGRWVTPRGGLYHPKAAGIQVVYPVGDPTPVDQEPLESADGYPTVESDSGFERPDRSADWCYQDALAAARDRVERRQAKDDAEVVDALSDLADDRPPEVVAAGIRGATTAERYLKGELGVDDLSTAEMNAVKIAAAETVDALFTQVDEADHDTLVGLLAPDDDADGEVDG